MRKIYKEGIDVLSCPCCQNKLEKCPRSYSIIGTTEMNAIRDLPIDHPKHKWNLPLITPTLKLKIEAEELAKKLGLNFIGTVETITDGIVNWYKINRLDMNNVLTVDMNKVISNLKVRGVVSDDGIRSVLIEAINNKQFYDQLVVKDIVETRLALLYMLYMGDWIEFVRLQKGCTALIKNADFIAYDMLHYIYCIQNKCHYL